MITGSKQIHNEKTANSFTLIILSVTAAHIVFLYIAGYFSISLISDDYLNFISASISTLSEKFSGSVPYYSHYHFRPLWFLSIEFSIYVNSLLQLSKDNFILYRIENLIYFYAFVMLAAVFFKKLTANNFLSVIFFITCILYPCNLNSICWTAGRVDLMCGIFIMSALIFSFGYFRSGKMSDFIFALIFLFMSLCTKETSVIIPFVTLVIFFISKAEYSYRNLRNLILFELAILTIYLLFKIFFIGNSPSEVISIYGNNGLFNIGGVMLRAFISLMIPYDYLSLQYNLSVFDFTLISYIAILLLTAVSLFFSMNRFDFRKYLPYVAAMLVLSVMPNLIAGYFRPQLILIPFVVTVLSLFLVVSKYGNIYKAVKMLFILIIAYWSFLSFNLVKDWNFAGQNSIKDIKELCKADLKFREGSKIFIIGLPSRYRQASMLDYASGPFNYWCGKGFTFENKITDFIHTGALDENSLNSELRISILSGKEFDITATGKTQYLLKLDITGNEFKDKEAEIIFSEFNSFGKPVKARVKFFSDDSEVYIFSEGKISRAGI